MRLSRLLVLASAIAVASGCRGDVSRKPDVPKTTYELPPEVMAVIPAGEYLVTGPLLSPGKRCTAEVQYELDKLDEAQLPQTKQAVAAFAIDKQRVSCRDFLDCVRQHGCNTAQPGDDRYECRAGEAYVHSDQAEAYCAWRGHKLPSLAQWQAAARGPDGAQLLDARCMPSETGTVCQAISPFGVLVSAHGPGGYDDELTRSTDCFPAKATRQIEPDPDDGLGRFRTIAFTSSVDVGGNPKLVVTLVRPEIGFTHNRKRSRSRYVFRCASDRDATPSGSAP